MIKSTLDPPVLNECSNSHEMLLKLLYIADGDWPEKHYSTPMSLISVYIISTIHIALI